MIHNNCIVFAFMFKNNILLCLSSKASKPTPTQYHNIILIHSFSLCWLQTMIGFYPPSTLPQAEMGSHYSSEGTVGNCAFKIPCDSHVIYFINSMRELGRPGSYMLTSWNRRELKRNGAERKKGEEKRKGRGN